MLIQYTTVQIVSYYIFYLRFLVLLCPINYARNIIYKFLSLVFKRQPAVLTILPVSIAISSRVKIPKGGS